MKACIIGAVLYLTSFNTLGFGDSNFISDKELERIVPNLMELVTVEAKNLSNRYLYDSEGIKNDLMMIYSNKGIFSIPKYDFVDYKKNLKDTANYFTYQLLYNETVWKDMFWKEWDALPLNIMQRAVDKQFADYSIYLHPSQWKSMNSEEWDDVPGVIKLGAFLKMIEIESIETKLTDYFLGSELSAKQVMAGIILTESFMFRNAVWNDDKGLTQISPYAKNKLKNYPDFKHLKKIDLFNPYVAIKAGTKWFKNALEDANGNLDIAISAYNTGINSAKRNTKYARKYRSVVYDRILDYVVGDETKSATFKYVRNKVWTD